MGSNRPSFRVGSNAIAAAGTAEQCDALVIPQGTFVVIHARPGNTGNLYIGNSKAQAEAHHFTMEPGATVELQTDNLSDVWIDAATNDDAVEWITEVMSE